MPTNEKRSTVMRAVYIRRRIMVLLLLILLGWGLVELASEETISCSVASVTVQPNDTMWKIAQRSCTPSHRTGDIVQSMLDLNGGNPSLQIGQTILLP